MCRQRLLLKLPTQAGFRSRPVLPKSPLRHEPSLPQQPTEGVLSAPAWPHFLLSSALNQLSTFFYVFRALAQFHKNITTDQSSRQVIMAILSKKSGNFTYYKVIFTYPEVSFTIIKSLYYYKVLQWLAHGFYSYSSVQLAAELNQKGSRQRRPTVSSSRRFIPRTID